MTDRSDRSDRPGPPGEPGAAWRALDLGHHLHPFTDHKALARTGSRIVTRGAGLRIWDADGTCRLDAMSGLWNVILGYDRRELIEAAARQLHTLPFYNSFFGTTTAPAVELAARLAALAPRGLERVMFMGSGSEANDTAIRLARHYWRLAGRPDKTVLIGRHRGFHGSTLASASLGGMAPMHAQGGLPLPGFAHIAAPDPFRDGAGQDASAFGRAAAAALEAKIHELGPDHVAAFVAEPIQGAGGVVIPPASYWPEIQRICRAHDVLLVLDEVITGFGRLGRWFGAELYGLEPDMITLAKGLTSGYLPLAAVLVSDRVADALIERGGEFHHGFTAAGHPVACATALATIEVMTEERLVERVAEVIGPYFQARLAELAGHDIVGEVRGLGLLAALELVADKASRRRFAPEGLAGVVVREYAHQHGLVVRTVSDIVMLAPALVITRAEIDELATLLRRALDDAEDALRRHEARTGSAG